MNVIKPCPFCGCEYSKDDDDFFYSGEHEKWCPLANLGLNVIVDEDDIENWNRRYGETDDTDLN